MLRRAREFVVSDAYLTLVERVPASDAEAASPASISVCPRRRAMGESADALLDAVKQREDMASTAQPSGVALPHPHRPEPVRARHRAGPGRPERIN